MTSPRDHDRPTECRSALTGTIRRCCAVLTGSAALGTALTLADQAVVSGTNFFTTLMIGRMCGPEELGLYSLGFTLVLLANLFQQSLVAVPYTVFCGRLEQSRQAEYAGSALVHVGVLSIVTMVGFAAWVGAIAAGFGPPQMVGVVWLLVGIIPFLIIRDFARNYAYAHLRVREALVLDVVVSSLHIGGFLLLVATGGLTATAVFAVIGVSALIGAMPWLWMRRAEFKPRLAAARAQLSDSWSFARWIFAGRMASYVGSVVPVWLLAVVLGQSATGIFAACATVGLITNPFVLGMNQYLTPRVAHSYAQGARRLRQVVRQAGLLLGGVISAFCIVVALFGDEFMRLMYGDLYSGHHGTVVLLSLAILADAASMGASKGLWVLNRPDLDLLARFIGLVVTSVIAGMLILTSGIFGVACGLAIGTAADAVARCVFFERQIATTLERETVATEGYPRSCSTLPSMTPDLGVAE